MCCIGGWGGGGASFPSSTYVKLKEVCTCIGGWPMFVAGCCFAISWSNLSAADGGPAVGGGGGGKPLFAVGWGGGGTGA